MDLQNIEPLQYPNLYGKRQPKQPSGIQSKRCVGRERAAQRARLHAQAFCPPFLPSLPPLLTCITHTYLLHAQGCSGGCEQHRARQSGAVLQLVTPDAVTVCPYTGLACACLTWRIIMSSLLMSGQSVRAPLLLT